MSWLFDCGHPVELYRQTDESEEMTVGYKHTEAGVIPEDWRIDQVSSVADVRTGPFGSALHQHDYVDDGTPIITVEHLGEHSIKHHNLPQVSDADRLRLKSYELLTGDIVFSRVGSIDRNALVSKKENGWLFSGRLLRVRVLDCKTCPAYLSYYFASEPFRRRILSVAVGQTMASLNTQIMRNVFVVLPPPPKQQAIAEALSDVDGLLDSLEALIAKKRAIKQAAMQQLLTGQTRLPDYRGTWETKRLSEFGAFRKGRGIRRDEVSSDGLPCIRYGELYTHYENHILRASSRIPPGTAQTALPVRCGDLLFAGSGETAEEIGRCAAYIGEETAYAGGDIIVMTPHGQDSLFLGHLMNYHTVLAQKTRMGQGDAVVHINTGNLEQICVRLPSVSEQRAIATVLSDMDAEIAGLEQRRAKTQAIKQGMMQVLLTGRVRLVKPGAVA